MNRRGNGPTETVAGTRAEHRAESDASGRSRGRSKRVVSNDYGAFLGLEVSPGDAVRLRHGALVLAKRGHGDHYYRSATRGSASSNTSMRTLRHSSRVNKC